MRDAPLSILAVFAHPDDEIGSGSTLVHYGGEGVLANLACASRGEAATIYCDDCATRETLAEVRTQELECACRNLGIAELRWLDWPDGGIAQLPRDAAIRQMVALIRELQPDIILTHPENGLYPHPDHLAVWEITRAAFDAAADREQYPGIGGAAWSAARLFTRAIPQSYFDAAPEFAAYRVELNGKQLPFVATPDEAIDVVMEVDCCVPQRLKAWECHRSQHNPNGAFDQMPAEVRQKWWEHDYYLMPATRAPLPPEGKHDLLAGLGAWTDRPAAAADQAATLVANLAVRRAYLELYGEYERTTNEPHFAAFLRNQPEAEQELIYALARGLRLADGTPGSVSADPRVLAQGRGCRSTRGRAQFLLIAARHGVARYRELAGQTAGSDGAALWEELWAMAEERLDAVARFAEAV
ncbi:MAG TPA: PIG-L family deacetylase [Anaerolineae bacterium]